MRRPGWTGCWLDWVLAGQGWLTEIAGEPGQGEKGDSQGHGRGLICLHAWPPGLGGQSKELRNEGWRPGDGHAPTPTTTTT